MLYHALKVSPGVCQTMDTAEGQLPTVWGREWGQQTLRCVRAHSVLCSLFCLPLPTCLGGVWEEYNATEPRNRNNTLKESLGMSSVEVGQVLGVCARVSPFGSSASTYEPSTAVCVCYRSTASRDRHIPELSGPQPRNRKL